MFSMNRIYIKTDKELSSKEIDMIRGIFRESNCPNESLRDTFSDAYMGVTEDNEYVFSFGVGTELKSIVLEY